MSRPEILNRKTMCVKFKGAAIVTSELTDRKQVADYGWCNKNIIKSEVCGRCGKDGVTSRRDRNTGAITYCY